LPLIFFFLVGCGHSKMDQNLPGEGAVGILDLHRMARSGQIKEFSVIYFPAENLTRGRLSSEMLEHVYRFKIVERDVGDGRLFGSFLGALEKTSVHFSEREADERWGFKAVAQDGHTVLTLYCNGDCSYGFINGVQVSLDGALSKWTSRLKNSLQ